MFFLSVPTTSAFQNQMNFVGDPANLSSPNVYEQYNGNQIELARQSVNSTLRTESANNRTVAMGMISNGTQGLLDYNTNSFLQTGSNIDMATSSSEPVLKTCNVPVTVNTSLSTSTSVLDSTLDLLYSSPTMNPPPDLLMNNFEFKRQMRRWSSAKEKDDDFIEEQTNFLKSLQRKRIR